MFDTLEPFNVMSAWALAHMKKKLKRISAKFLGSTLQTLKYLHLN